MAALRWVGLFWALSVISWPVVGSVRSSGFGDKFGYSYKNGRGTAAGPISSLGSPSVPSDSASSAHSTRVGSAAPAFSAAPSGAVAGGDDHASANLEFSNGGLSDGYDPSHRPPPSSAARPRHNAPVSGSNPADNGHGVTSVNWKRSIVGN